MRNSVTTGRWKNLATTLRRSIFYAAPLVINSKIVRFCYSKVVSFEQRIAHESICSRILDNRHWVTLIILHAMPCHAHEETEISVIILRRN
jgi:hypothetical protein